MTGRYLPWILAGTLVALAGCGADTTPTEPTPPVAAAAKGGGGFSSVTTMNVAGCDITVTFTWSGLKGRNLIAEFGVYEVGTSFDIGIDGWNVEGVNGASGSVSHTFNLIAGPTSRQIRAHGELVDSRRFQRVTNSHSQSGTAFSNCVAP